MSPPRLDKPAAELHRARWAGVVALAVAVVAAIAIFATVIVIQQNRLEASCKFYNLIATLPVANTPTPSRLGVLLVLDSRAAYVGQGCGSLPAPSVNLKRWTAHYGLKGD